MPFPESSDLGIDVWGGLNTSIPPSQLPLGASPACQDVMFPEAGVRTRDGLFSMFPALAGTPAINGLKTYITPTLQDILLVWDALGNLYQENVIGTLALLAAGGTPNIFMNSTTLFGREYIGFGNATSGIDFPRQFDGTNYDRITQCGPGQGPTPVNFLPNPAAIAGAGAGSPVNLAAAPTGAVTTGPFTITIPPYPPYYNGGTYTYYTTATYTTTGAHGLVVGQLVTVASVTNAALDAVDVPVIAVPSTTTFVLALANYIYAASGSGTVTPKAPALSRANNLVTATTSAAHGFVAGWTVLISGFAAQAVGGASTAVASNGIVTVTTATAHGLPIGAIAIVAGMSDATFDTPQGATVLSVPSSTSFTYQWLTSTSSATGGTVSSPWNGTYLITATPTPTSFIYQQLGPNLQSDGTGTATIVGNITAGNHQVSISFVTRQGYITKPAPPVNFAAAGGQLVQLTIPTGPSNIVARLIMFTPYIAPPATTGNFYSIQGGKLIGNQMLIQDNVTTNVTLDFSDTNLIAGFNAEYLFSQIELGEVYGAANYSSRTSFIGEAAHINNLLNMEFNGGWYFPSPVMYGPNITGAGTNGGGGHAWTNPNNVTSASAFATVALLHATSNSLLSETFSLAAPAGSPIGGVQASFFVKISARGSLLPTLSVQLLKAGVPVGNPKPIFLSNISYLTGTTVTLGSITDNWGAVLFGSDANAATFGLQITATNPDTLTSVTFSIDNVQMSVNDVQPGVPDGWTLDPINGLGGARFANGGEFLDAYQITGDGIDAAVGMITQPAFQDSLGVNIFNPMTAYSVRVRAKTSLASGATLAVELFSPSQGSIGIANFPLTGAGSFGAAYTTLTLSLGMMPTVQPSDLILRVYANNTLPLGTTITIDSLEPFQTNAPVNGSIVRLSYAFNPEGIDSVSGQVQIRPGDGQQIRAQFNIRGNLYIAKDRYLAYVTDDGQNEPASWQVTEVSSTIGICGPNAVDTGEEWAAFANENGVYMYFGSDPVKVSQEIQEDASRSGQITWNSINWAAASTIWVRIDNLFKRILVGVPVNGATVPNIVFMMDYKFAASGEDAASEPGSTYSAFTGRLLQRGGGRKWTIWNIAANSCALAIRPDGTQRTFFGNGASTGKIYQLTDGQYSDDGVAVNSFYVTSGEPTKDQEDALQLRGHRHVCDYLSGRAIGAGSMLLAVQSEYRNTFPRAVTLTAPGAVDFERPVNIHGYRLFYQLGTNAVGSWFQLEKLTPMMKADSTIPVAGVV